MLKLIPFKCIQTLSGGLCLVVYVSFSQPFAVWEGSQLVLDNGVIQRQIIYNPEGRNISTTSLNLNGSGTSYLSEHSDEFSFTVDGVRVSGKDPWQLSGFRSASDDLQGSWATVTLVNNSRDDLNIENLEIQDNMVHCWLRDQGATIVTDQWTENVKVSKNKGFAKYKPE